ncbi:plastocyanin/azurin family copper-binding protein [Blastococcus sp. VKM Ac-2987]|uniref:plastocyanin/azurin family copper-binding protein n=1 Tax=Blastococcus sp. VKM Ac-2987 TaxID=3004141 RepID=UPI0022AB6116|nr:plastocyanin/azurin family copper-binding protein [Blastococcus sp. VKM Ac-2987]MCZ2858355.1 plastocyanin/azurin family copper-binding protein [Blastococcus sp. VKM Ac-2987]
MSAWRWRRRAASVGAGAALVAGVLTGCGGGEEPAPAAPSTEGLGEVTVAADGVQEVTVETRDDYEFYPDTFTVDPGRVRLTVVNAADEMTHNLEYTDDELPAPIDAGVAFLAPGQEETVEFEVTTPGEYPFACTFHVQLGQVGTMTVSG